VISILLRKGLLQQTFKLTQPCGVLVLAIILVQ